MAGSMTSREKWILVSIVLGTFMGSLDATIVAVALPTMASEFAGSTADISWVLLGYTLALCCFILLWGRIGTNIGYKKVFITGVGIFSVCSALIGVAGYIDGIPLGFIIIMRIIQGLGAGMLVSMSLAMVGSYLPNTRGAAVGTVTLAASAGMALGPALGGLLCDIHWSMIFFINIPIGILCILLSLKSMAGVDERRPAKVKVDIVGVILMVLMMFTFIIYLNKGPDIGWMSHQGTAMILLLMVAAGLLVWWEQKVANPLISMRIIKIKDVAGGNMVALLLFGAMAGSYLLVPYFLEFCQGYSTVEMGLILIANSIGMMAVGPVVGKLSDKTGINSRMISAGCLISALGFFLMTLFVPDTGLWFVLLALFVMGAGMGMALVSSTNLCMGYSDEGEDGEMSGQINTFRQAGSSIGVAVLQAVFAANVAVSAGVLDLAPGFKPAFYMAMILALVAFVLSMFVKDKKIRVQVDGF